MKFPSDLTLGYLRTAPVRTHDFGNFRRKRCNAFGLILHRVLLLSAVPRTAFGASEWFTWTDLKHFSCETNLNAATRTWTSPRVTNSVPWEELVVSWNIAGSAKISVAARGFHKNQATRYYNLGQWTLAPDGPRSSPDSQRDADGHVATDTLVIARAADGFQVSLTTRWVDPPPQFVSVSTADAHPREEPLPPLPTPALRVPERTQTEYPEGVQSWCSPTTLEMLMTYWAERCRRPEWSHTLLETVAGVNDPGWPGTGNWPFNTAFAGSHDGLRACTVRANRPSDLVHWLSVGYPVGVSVSYALLNGEAQPTPGDGHLVVVCGGDAEGRLEINDPGRALPRVHRHIDRDVFVRAWAYSAYTAYLVWPADLATPYGAVELDKPKKPASTP